MAPDEITHAGHRPELLLLCCNAPSSTFKRFRIRPCCCETQIYTQTNRHNAKYFNNNKTYRWQVPIWVSDSKRIMVNILQNEMIHVMKNKISLQLVYGENTMDGIIKAKTSHGETIARRKHCTMKTSQGENIAWRKLARKIIFHIMPIYLLKL